MPFHQSTIVPDGHAADHNSARLDQADLMARIERAESEAARRCGGSDVLYDTLAQQAYEEILDRAPSSARAATELALKTRGYVPDWTPYVPTQGECATTGIDTFCCPCGWHE
jgi:hypothetical protein